MRRCCSPARYPRPASDWALSASFTDPDFLQHMQGKQELVGGVGRGSELETEIDPINARQLLDQPNKLLNLHVDFVDELQK